MRHSHKTTLNPLSESEALDRCRRAIEESLHWGDATEWRHGEFVDLAERIFRKTEVKLSANTLKRVWGKLPYASTPSNSTLNALAQFLGFENWANYRNQISIKTVVQKVGEPSHGGKKLTQRWFSSLRWIVSFIVLILVGLVAMWIVFPNGKEESVPSVHHERRPSIQNRLTSTLTSDDVPNTVVFKYDLAGLNGDKFEIQQTWDKRLRFPINPAGNTMSSTYYLPGYWHAKLVVDDKIVEETDVYIATKGWLGTIDTEPIPIYFRESDLLNGRLLIRDNAIDEIAANQTQLPSITYHYIQAFEGVNVDDLTLDIALQNTQAGGRGACRFTSIILVGTSGRVVIPLAIKGCVGDLRLRVGEVLISGKTQDMTTLGCDYSQVQRVRCEISEFRARIYLNDQLVQSVAYQQPMGKFAGIRAKFQGRGLIKSVLVRDPAGRHLIEYGVD